jgi:hypothetical protein
LIALFAVALAACTPQKPRHLEFVAAPASGDVAVAVNAQLAAARSERRRLLVYVGASWCEPCKRFHRAAESGALDDRFGDLRFLEFDHDRDGERLASAGYASSMIPLFALPARDGRGTGRQIEGSIKGDGAVQEITPRLESLLAAAR